MQLRGVLNLNLEYVTRIKLVHLELGLTLGGGAAAVSHRGGGLLLVASAVNLY